MAKSNSNVVAINAPASKTTKKPFAERFAGNLTQQPNGCQVWTGAINPVTGYGETYLGGKVIGAHRAAYILKFGCIPEGKFVCHTCDVPTCCQTGDEQGTGSHLFIGDAAANNRDKALKGRSTLGKTFQNKRYSKDEKTNILTMHMNGTSAYAIGQQTGKSVPGISKFLRSHKAITAAKIRANAENIIAAVTEFNQALNTLLHASTDTEKAA